MTVMILWMTIDFGNFADFDYFHDLDDFDSLKKLIQILEEV